MSLNVAQEINRWVVLRPDDNRKGHYICRCKCGREQSCHPSNIRSGRSTRCRVCRNTINGKEHPAFRGCGSVSRKLWGRYRRLAKQRGIPFELSVADMDALFESQGRRCRMTGLPLVIAPTCKERRGQTTASLDRIDSSGGYTLDNIQWVHVRVNLMKLDMTQDEFVDWCRRVVDFAGRGESVA